ncbi:MAG TPA: hypothetical protein VHW24_14910 [Bryobacteraceae bacterium]|nr:hypothetical protein [Bryobacteraceae bacterium]
MRIATGRAGLTGIQRVARGFDLAGGFAVKDVVGGYAVNGEAVAGVALAVGPDRLVTEAGVGAGGIHEIGGEAGAQDGQLREAARAERRVVDGL